MAVERTEGPLITESGEFYYAGQEERVWVRKEQEYYKVYESDKKVSYQLVLTDQRIIKDKPKSLLEAYYNLGAARPTDKYPTITYPTGIDLPFKKKYIKRIFAINKLHKNEGIIEVVAPTNSTAYKYTSVQWQISGSLDVVKAHNKKQLMKAERIIPGISEEIPIDQLHQSKFDLDQSSDEMLDQSSRYSKVNFNQG